MSSELNGPTWSEARNVLCVRLDAAGNVLATAPAIRALKNHRPGRAITVLTSSVGAEAARLIGEIDEIGVYDPSWMDGSPGFADGDSDGPMIERLRRQHFDAAVIFTPYGRSPQPAALLAALAGIPLRLAHSRENPYGLLTDWVREPETREPAPEWRRYLDLVAAVGAVEDETELPVRTPPPMARL